MPGLGGKNVIDILLLVLTKKIAIQLIENLKSIGYNYPQGTTGDRYRIFFNRNPVYNGKKIHIHLHLMWKSAEKYQDYLVFRNYLRKNPKEARRYYELKKKWAKEIGKETKKFPRMKTAYIKEILKKAKTKGYYKIF